MWAALLALAFTRADPCVGLGTTVLVEARAHRLFLCEGGVTGAWYHVALGRHGLGVGQPGVGLTPLGVMPVGTPEPSARYGVFLPLGDGELLGIHGPARETRWLGELSAWVDWTDGSVALGFDRQVQFLAVWVSAHHVTHALLR